MTSICITENQLLEVAKKGRVDIYNLRFNTSNEELELLREYPHYFYIFAENGEIDEIMDDPDYTKLYNLTMPLFLCGPASITDESYRQELKDKIYNLIINNETFMCFIHRYVQDFVIPNKKKQEYVDKLKQKRYKEISDGEHRIYGTMNLYKNPNLRTVYPTEKDYKDFLLK